MANRALSKVLSVIGQGEVVQHARVAKDVACCERSQVSRPCLRLVTISRPVSPTTLGLQAGPENLISVPIRQRVRERNYTRLTIRAAVGSLRHIGHVGIAPPFRPLSPSTA